MLDAYASLSTNTQACSPCPEDLIECDVFWIISLSFAWDSELLRGFLLLKGYYLDSEHCLMNVVWGISSKERDIYIWSPVPPLLLAFPV